ncbi:HlyD family type I secretion periplasmic adaptor subunit [Burkholderia sp. LMU1-1-1.1]|uniref:HlyD family type I secretion periplasmic adaptor subunit n=1 Tax=Burkholderia sp. LMU1-1-1.1 TaxID=3135266 RepID=UPI003447E4FB
MKNRENSLSRAELSFLPATIRIQETPPSPAARRLALIIAGSAIFLIAWSFIGTIDVYAQAQGRLVPSGRVKFVQSVDAGVVSAISMSEGQHVLKGQILMKLDPLINQTNLNNVTDRINLNKIEVKRLEAEMSGGPADYRGLDISASQRLLQEALRSTRDNMHSSRITEAKNLVHSKKIAFNAAEDALRKSHKLLETIREREEKVRPYIGEVMPKFDYLRLKDSLVEAENDVQSGTNRVVEAQEEVRTAEQRIVQLSEEWRGGILAEVSQKRNELVQLDAEFIKLGQLVLQRELRSPVDGILQNVNISAIGAVLGPGQPVASIVPSMADLIVEASLPNEDIGFVEVNQEVEIKVDGYPSHRYGSIKGTVIQISPDSEDMNYSPTDGADQKKSKNVPTKSGVLYRIKIRPLALFIKRDGSQLPLLSGMTVVADIKTDKRKIIDFLISPIVKTFAHGLKDR